MAYSSSQTVPKFRWSGTYKDLVNEFNSMVDEDVIADIVFHHNNNLPLAYEDLCEIAPGIRKPSNLLQDVHLSSNENKNEVAASIDSSNHFDGLNWERLSKNESPINRILYLVSKHYKVMVIMRGCSGSGKSYQATNILSRCYKNADVNEFIFSADKFFTDKCTGHYRFNASKLTAAHQWSYDNVQKAVFKEVTPVIVDNTNTEAWEMEVYVKLAVNHGYWIEIVEPLTEWAWNGIELFKKNVHNLPLNSIMSMLGRYDHNITTDSLLTHFKLKYNSRNQPPLFSKHSKNYQLCENIMDNSKVANEPLTGINDVSNNFKDLHVSPIHENNTKKQLYTNFNNTDEDPWVTNIVQEKVVIPTTNELNNDTSDVDEESQSISSTEGASNYAHKSVNTCENDLLFMEVLNELPEEEYKSFVVFGKNRDINERSTNVLSVPCGKLDKGTTTSDLRKVVCKPNLNELRKQFPEDVCLLITELFEKCEGDIDWIVDMFAELGYNVSKQQLHSLFQSKENNFDTNISNSENTIGKSRLDNNLLFSPKLQPKAVKSIENKMVAETYCKKKYSKKLLDPNAKEFSLTNNDLKKDIESKFTFGDSLYSEHVLKIKKIKDNQSMFNCDNAMLPPQIESVNVDSERNYEGKFVQLVVDPSVLAQLCDYFGDFSSDISKSTLPMSVKLPEKLAEDLYYCLIANVPTGVFNQEAILKDEILARKLQEDFKEECVPNIENSCTGELSFAAVLSKKLLLEKFKHLDPKLVLKVFHANEYKLQNASDVLSAACGIGCLTNQENRNTVDNEKSCVDEDKYDDSSSNQKYRQEALEHAHMRQQYLNKANQSLSTKIHPSVTGYYLDKAEESKQHEKYANTKALIEMIKSHENSTILDLHYLQVQEAILVLDLYLDHHISKLKKFNCEYSRGRQLTIITGRGKHSPKGVARIKPAVVRKLQFRQLAFLEPDSPGLIMVIIKRTSLLSSEL